MSVVIGAVAPGESAENELTLRLNMESNMETFQKKRQRVSDHWGGGAKGRGAEHELRLRLNMKANMMICSMEIQAFRWSLGR